MGYGFESLKNKAIRSVHFGSLIARFTALLFITPAAVTAVLLGLSAPVLAQASFEGLGDLPGSFIASFGATVSNDGQVVVGSSFSSNGNEAFRWTKSGAMVGLGDLSGGSFDSSALDVSADGSVVVGIASVNFLDRAFRWTQAGGMVDLSFGIPPGGFLAHGRGVSADGSVITGQANFGGNSHAFRWTQGAGIVDIGVLPGASNSNGNSVSADGSVVVGASGGQPRKRLFSGRRPAA